jgi:hypothetical protein
LIIPCLAEEMLPFAFAAALGALVLRTQVKVKAWHSASVGE